MKIIELKAENIKRLKAVEIRPDEKGGLVVVGGKNGAGKSSVLDAIMYALAGKASIPDVPIREGQRKGEVEVDLGDLHVTRTFTQAGGSQLRVTDATGDKVGSPQKLLDRLVGRLAFDPIEFSRLDPKAQLRALKEVVGLDFGKVDAERMLVYERRTEIRRDLRALEARHDQMPHHTDVPEGTVDVSLALEDLDAAIELNASSADLDVEVIDAETLIVDTEKELRRLDRLVAKEKSALRKAEAHLEAVRNTAAQAAEKLVDIKPIQERIRNAETINTKIRENDERGDLNEEILRVEGLVQEKSDLIEAIDRNKREALENADFPIEGLAFDEDGVVLNGLPFSQASSSEQLRVSAAMGLAVNPDLRVLLIRDGSLLDPDSLAFLGEFATENDAQIWLERVSDGDEVSVLIEDGTVARKKKR